MKKLSSMLAALVLSIASFILPISQANVYATAPANANTTYGSIQINGATSLEDVDDATSVAATFEHGTATITGTGLYSNGTNMVYALGDVTVTAVPAENYTADLWDNGADLGAATTNLNLAVGNFHNMDVIFSDNTSGGSGGDNNVGNTNATVHVSAGTGTYTINGQSRSYDTVEAFSSPENGGAFSINGSMWNPGTEAMTYNSEDTDTTVTFNFGTLWINRYYDTIVINEVPYTVSNYLDFDDRTAWLNANHGTQLIDFDIPNVPKAAEYNIVVKHGENNGTRYLATFLWTADPAQAGGKNYIGHSKLEFVRAEYTVGTTTYNVEASQINLTRDGRFLVGYSPDGFLSYGVVANVDFDDGQLTLPGGAKVTMRVVPEYGYQVTEVNGGGDFTTTDAGVSEFTVVVADGTAGYFRAEVIAVDDEVVAGSEKVAGGNIELSGDDIESGTARLSVDDVELSDDKKDDFKSQIDGSYKISSYLDINLSKVLYRGTAESVWSEEIHHLRHKALVSLQLAEGVDGNDIVIVHNIDDGDEYEVIEIESYDPVTNIITFWVSSFSNYAIASRTVASPNSGAASKTVAAGASFATTSFSATFFMITILSAAVWTTFRLVKR